MPETCHALCRFPECATEIGIVQPGTPGPQYRPVPAHGGEVAVLGRDAALHLLVQRLLFGGKLRGRKERQTHDRVFLVGFWLAQGRGTSEARTNSRRVP